MTNVDKVSEDELTIYLLGGIKFSMKANNSMMVTNTTTKDCVGISCMGQGDPLVYSLQHRGFRVYNTPSDTLMFHLDGNTDQLIDNLHAGEIVKVMDQFFMKDDIYGVDILDEMKTCQEVYCYEDELVTPAVKRKILKMRLGVQAVYYPDGRAKYYFPNGVNVVQEKEGNTLIDFPDNGTIVIRPEGGLLFEHRHDCIDLMRNLINVKSGSVRFRAMKNFIDNTWECSYPPIIQ